MILRRPVRHAVAHARAAHAAGDFAAARRSIEPVVVARGAPLEAVRGMAELEYLLGDYDAAEALLDRIVNATRASSARRLDAEAALALVHYRTGRYDKARGLFAGGAVDMPVWSLMTAFGNDPPYAIEWPDGEPQATVPLTQTAPWELPIVSLEVDGVALDAWIDTGGDMLTLPHDVASALGVEPRARFTGTYAGGAQADGYYGRVASVRLGSVTLRNVPIATAGFERAVIGTGFLSRFLATIDYPRGRLALRPHGSAPSCADAVEVPFALALTHLMVATGSLAGRAGLTFLVDSGLRDEQGAAFTAPAETLVGAGIPLPGTHAVTDMSGAGDTILELGRFGIPRLGLGSLFQHDLVGLYGAFPAELGVAATGFPIAGLISHHFLRRYRWTIDFARMSMWFEGPAVDGSPRWAGWRVGPGTSTALGGEVSVRWAR